MSKITVAYWSGTGNTEAMAEAVGEGIKAAGKECAVVSVSDISVLTAGAMVNGCVNGNPEC